ncbi:hypothetical protein EG834_10310 [bacterium]|nr:hypothetical protein [bacterium]
MTPSFEDRMKILKMVQEGKLTAEDAAELLSALEESIQDAGPTRTANAAPAEKDFPGSKARWMRVRVTDTNTGKTRVNVRLPIGVVNAAVKMGKNFAPEIEGLDLVELMNHLKEGSMGNVVDVYDDEDGEHVEVFLE